MQAISILKATLKSIANEKTYLFSPTDLRAAFPAMSDTAFRALLTRANKTGLLLRLCRGLYIYPDAPYPAGQLLYHAAARLREDAFNYISLESQLSYLGVISQIPINYLTIMTTGRKSKIVLANFGTIEFTHSYKQYESIAQHLTFDSTICLHRADKELAYQDLKNVGRNLDLVNMEELASG